MRKITLTRRRTIEEKVTVAVPDDDRLKELSPVEFNSGVFGLASRFSDEAWEEVSQDRGELIQIEDSGKIHPLLMHLVYDLLDADIILKIAKENV